MYVLTTVTLQWAKSLIIAPIVQYRRAPIPVPGLVTPPWPFWHPDFEDGALCYLVAQFMSKNPNELLKEATEEGLR